MSPEEKEMRYKISDIARELQVSPQEVLQFVKEAGGKVASTSSMVKGPVRDLILNQFSDEKKLVDETRKIRKEKQLRLSRLEEQSRKTYEKEQQLKDIISGRSERVSVQPKTEPRSHSEVIEQEEAVREPEALETVSGTGGQVEVAENETPVKVQDVPGPEDENDKEGQVSFESPQKIGGLTVFGTIDVESEPGAGDDVGKKKKRKKRFKEQADELKGEFDIVVREEEQVAEEKAPSDKKPLKKEPGESPEAAKEPGPSKRKKGKKKKKPEVDEKTIEQNIRSTISGMDEGSGGGASRQRFRKMRKIEREKELEAAEAIREAQRSIVRVTEFATAHELADLMGVTPKEIIQHCFTMGKFVTINQRLDKETIELVALEFGFETEFVSEVEATEIMDTEDREEDMEIRPPVVTIMGHVDHGKTSLLDYIRSSNVVAGESGGITQHIGAYEVSLDGDRKITFLDTPGHEAFTAMRARGAQVTDIVVLVVSADDSVMPQTIEAINHSKAAEVPIVVAINKIDKPEANPEKIKTQLSEAGVLVEDWGGEYQCQEISAKKGTGIGELMEKVLTEAEIRELKANFSRDIPARGIIVEAELDKGKGVVSTVLVQRSFLKVGDPFVAGHTMGRVRALMDERGKRIREAGPSQPVSVLGFEELPQSGDEFTVMHSDREAREIAQKRQIIRREHEFRRSTRVKLDSIARQIKEGLMKELSVIIKADTDGSIQALADGLMKIHNEEVKVQIIHQGVGQITETDVLLAAASDAIIIGFRVRPNVNAKRLAEKEDLDVRFYSVIYHVIEDIEQALEGMLSPELHEESIGSLEIRQVFKVPKIGNVAGCYVLEGKVFRDSRVRLLREGVQVYDGELDSLKRFKDDVKEVDAGYECGLNLKGYSDIKVGDIIEGYRIVEKKRKL